MQKLVWQNSNNDVIDLTSGNFGITEWEGFSNTDLNIQSQQVPFQDGGVFLDALIEQRELSVTLAMYDGGSLETRYRLRRELIHALNPKLGEGYLIYTNDFISKRIKCVAQIPLFETHNSNDSGTPKASLTWTACDPYWEDLEETEINLTAGVVENVENNGDVPVPLKIEIIGNVTNPRIINETNEKTVGLKGVFTNGVDINTGLGEKVVTSKNIFFERVEGGNICDCATNGIITVYVGGQIFISGIDGIIKNINQSVSHELRSIIFDGEKFVSVGEAGLIAKSYDGYKWEFAYIEGMQNIGFDQILYVNNQYVILSRVAGIFVTTDLENITLKFSSIAFTKIKYINNTYFICGAKLWTSTDLDSINIILNSGTNDILYINGKYFAYGTTSIKTSFDLSNWNTENNLVFSIVAYNNMRFIGSKSGTILCESYDGINWNELVTITDSVYQNINIINNVFIAVGLNGLYTQVTEDAVINKNTDFTTMYLRTVKKLNNVIFYLYCTVGEWQYGMGYTVINGIRTRINIGSDLRKRILNVIYRNNEYILYTVIGEIYKSSDAINWQSTEYICPVMLSSCEINNSIYGVDGSKNVYKSNDGYNFTIIFTSQNVSFYSVNYGFGKFVCIGRQTNDKLGSAVSLNGVDWTEYTPNTNINVFSENLRVGKDCFIFSYLSGSNNNFSVSIIFSYDGAHWESKIIKTYNNIFGGQNVCNILYKDGVYYIVTSIGKIIKSVNLNDWEEIQDYYYVCDILDFESKLLISGNNMLLLSQLYNYDNAFSKITQISNMTLNLEKSNNNILYVFDEGVSEAKIKFRQKYIGV